jgi:hypothetical protein
VSSPAQRASPSARRRLLRPVDRLEVEALEHPRLVLVAARASRLRRPLPRGRQVRVALAPPLAAPVADEHHPRRDAPDRPVRVELHAAHADLRARSCGWRSAGCHAGPHRRRRGPCAARAGRRWARLRPAPGRSPGRASSGASPRATTCGRRRSRDRPHGDWAKQRCRGQGVVVVAAPLGFDVGAVASRDCRSETGPRPARRSVVTPAFPPPRDGSGACRRQDPPPSRDSPHARPGLAAYSRCLPGSRWLRIAEGRGSVAQDRSTVEAHLCPERSPRGGLLPTCDATWTGGPQAAVPHPLLASGFPACLHPLTTRPHHVHGEFGWSGAEGRPEQEQIGVRDGGLRRALGGDG